VYGFTSMLVNLLRDHRPDALVVAFDRPEPTFRHEKVETYKANREAAPDILRQQMGLVRQVVETLGIPIVEVPGFEADDVIATLATQARDRGDDVIVVTGDRDTYQLVEDPHVKVLYNKRGVSDYALYDEAGIAERTGVPPALYPQYAALRGDPSDNLPGVPGVGEKTAAKLITTYGGIDGIYEHVEDQTPKLRANLAEHEAQVRSNAEVMVLVRDVPLDFSSRTAPSTRRHRPRGAAPALRVPRVRHPARPPGRGPGRRPGPEGRRGHGAGGRGRHAGGPRRGDRGPEALAGRTPRWRWPAWEGAEGRSALTGLALVAAPETADVHWLPGPCWPTPGSVTPSASCSAPRAGRLAAHHAKPLLRALTGLDVDVRSLFLDTSLAAYLLDPAEGRYLLEELVVRYAGATIPEGDAAAEGQLDLDGGSRGGLRARRPPGPGRGPPGRPLLAAMDAQGLRRLHDDIEVPLVRVLARMEDVGVGVDVTSCAACGTGWWPTWSATGPPSSRPPATTST
jgi:DNA polymerase I